MTPESWKQIKRIFDEAVELAPSELGVFLDAACGSDPSLRREVERMLAADPADDLEESAFSLFDRGEAAAFRGRRVGRYRILEEVGRGGMGAVFAAVRDDGEFEQRVALKVIKSGLSTSTIVRRFRHERQILASLEHPNIARLLDGGMSDDGLPFYVMEFIEGEPIDEYCRARHLGVRERLELFRQVCAAVSYAHRRLIVHRDLKPSNILVTGEGRVKLLDFGIAKVLSQSDGDAQSTATQLGLMTPDYASPEQFRGETVTTSTDVYSLGVVLYELLTGVPPYDLRGLRLDQMLRLVCETEPPRPSQAIADGGLRNADLQTRPMTAGAGDDSRPVLRIKPQSAIGNPQSLKGDLDNIVLKALRKEPERRYESVEQFAEDIRRHLNELPVSARPDTFAYRASKFVRRNRVGVVAASLIFVALIAGILGTAYQARVAQRERGRAEKRFEQVRKLANNVVFKYHDAIASLPGATATREMLVKDATEYLDNLSQDAQDNPALAQELALAYLKIGNVQGEAYQANVGDTAGALASYRKSLAILERLAAERPGRVEYLRNLHAAAQATAIHLVRLQRWREAEEAGERQLQLARRLDAAEPGARENRNLLARSYQVKGETVEFSGGHEECVRWYRLSLEEAERAAAEDPSGEAARRVLASALQRLGTRLEYRAAMLGETGEPPAALAPLYAEAEAVHRRSYQLCEGLRRDFPEKALYVRFVAASSLNLGTALARTGKGQEGIPLIVRSLETLRATSEGDPKNQEARRDVAETWQYMAFAREAMGQTDEAIEADRHSLKILEEITAGDHANVEFLRQTHSTYNHAGDLLARQGKLGEALDYYQRGMAYAARVSAVNDSPQVAFMRSESHRKLGEVYLALAAAGRDHGALAEARAHLLKAHEDLLVLQQRNELGRNHRHKLALVAADMEKAAQLSTQSRASAPGPTRAGS
ncbi:MAG TPA: serine/threonine-protein kinase [Pyrinomonadaceae bacterium]|nr:serine/threonine-protein kinase [Pyrinomonadaceae bacterium]